MKLEKLQCSKWTGPLGIMGKILSFEVFLALLLAVYYQHILNAFLTENTVYQSICRELMFMFSSAWLALTSSKKWLYKVFTDGQLYGLMRKHYFWTFQIMPLKVCHSFERHAYLPILVIASKTGNNEEISVLRVTFQSTVLCSKLVKSMGILLVAFSYANKYNC